MRHDLRVTSPAPDLLELAHAYGVATEFNDWRGRTVAVAPRPSPPCSPRWTSTCPTRRPPWPRRHRRALAPDAAAVRGRAARAPRGRSAVHVDHGAPVEVCDRPRDRRAPRRAPPGRPLGRRRARSTAGWSARRPSRSPTTCRWATTALRARSGDDRSPATLIVTPALARTARAAGPRPVVGPRDAALQRALAALVGRRRPRRPDRPRGLVGRRAGRRLRAGQPAARRRARGAAGAVALPAHLAALLQPALRARRAGPGVRRAGGRRPRDRRRARGRRARRASTLPTSSTATPRGPPSGPPSQIVHAVPRSAGREPRPGRVPRRHGSALRDVATWSVHRRRARHRLPRVARRAAGRRPRRRSRRSPRARATRSTSRPGCSGSSTSSSSMRRPRPSAPGWRSAPCTTSPSACTPAAPTSGGCGRRTPRGSRSARRRTRSTRSARTGASRRGAPTGSRSSATRRSAT